MALVRSLTAVLLAAAPALAEAKSLSVSASLSQDRIYVGEVVTLEVIAVATSDGNVEIDVPDIAGLDELRRGQSDSTSISWNGSQQTLRRERTLRVDFEAKKSGAVAIPPIAVRLGNEEEHAAALTLTVLANGQEEHDAAPGRVAAAGEVIPPEADERDLFVRYRVDRPKAFVGEQIIVDLEVFTSGAYNLDEQRPPPSPDGFWREILEQADRMTARTERVQGKSYRVYRLWRMALFPLSAGEKLLPQTQLSFSQNRSIFAVGQRVRRSAPPLKIEALAPPAEGRPRDFLEGNVGNYTLEAKVDTTEIEPGKGVVLTIALGGAGNITGSKLPEVKTLDGFRVFPAKIVDEVLRTATGVTGTRRAEILLVPTKGGRLVIPALSLAVFNPDKRDYERLTTPEIAVHAQGTPSISAQLGAAPAPAAGEGEARSPLRPIRLRSQLSAGRERFLGSPVFWGLLLTPPLGYAAALALLALLRKRPVESHSARARRVAKEVQASLGRAESELSSGDPARAYGTLSEAILALAGDRAAAPLRGLTSSELERALRESGAPPELVGNILEILRRADFGRFAPGGGDPKTARATLELARSVAAELESWEVQRAQ